MNSWSEKVNEWWKTPSSQRLLLGVQDSSIVKTAVNALIEKEENILANLVSHSLSVHLVKQYLMFLHCCHETKDYGDKHSRKLLEPKIIRSIWNRHQLDLIDYKNDCKLFFDGN